jgi:hypothetical protein
MGPKQLASTYLVDELLLLRLEQRPLIKLLDSPGAAPKPADTSGFEDKFQKLRQACPGQEHNVDIIRDEFMRLWCEHIKTMDELNNSFPNLYHRVVRLLKQAAHSANLKSLNASAAEANQLIEDVTTSVADSLKADLPEGYSKQLADGIVASLIGDCPLGWRT